MHSTATNASNQSDDEEVPRDIIRIKGTKGSTKFVLIDRETESLIDMENSYRNESDAAQQLNLEDLDDAEDIAASARVKEIDRRMKHFFCFMMIFWSIGVLAVIYMLMNQKKLKKLSK